jgi:hypothetical protein
MNQEPVIIQVSSKTYWGFRHEIPWEKIKRMTCDEVIEELKQNMKTVFQRHNLLVLSEGVDELKLHLCTFPSAPGSTSYACDHPHD